MDVDRRTAEAYGPNTATASAGAVTVTATAKVSQIVWDMGDGHTGHLHHGRHARTSRPTARRVHRTAATATATPPRTKPGQKYPVTATSTWTIDWRGGGQTGQLTQTRQSQTQVSIGQLKVLN